MRHYAENAAGQTHKVNGPMIFFFHIIPNLKIDFGFIMLFTMQNNIDRYYLVWKNLIALCVEPLDFPGLTATINAVKPITAREKGYVDVLRLLFKSNRDGFAEFIKDSGLTHLAPLIDATLVIELLGINAQLLFRGGVYEFIPNNEDKFDEDFQVDESECTGSQDSRVAIARGKPSGQRRQRRGRSGRRDDHERTHVAKQPTPSVPERPIGRLDYEKIFTAAQINTCDESDEPQY